ncbi:MAG: hypothetical protein IPN53_05875 [Comamonadaceae bacterium]|nr:hypothetical protein [Comamonadaceae bacterium]
MLGWFDSKQAEEFGNVLGQYLIDRMSTDKKLSASKFAAKTESVLLRMELQVRSFKQKEKLNFYKTAKLVNAFRWKLKDAGYDEAFIEKLVEWLLSHT